MEPPPSLSLISANFLPTSSNASSHVDGVSLPFLRISGCLIRSSLLAKSKAYRPLMHKKSPFVPLLSRLSPRTISMPVSERRTPRVVLQPSPQCVQTVPTCFISHGRVLYRYAPEVRAPTGQMSMHMPHSSHSRWSSLLGAMMDETPRFCT